MKCLGCGKETKYRSNKKYCSDLCRVRTNSKQYYKEGRYIYRKTHPKKYREKQLNYYYKHKDKHICRVLTYNIFASKGQVCKDCGINRNLRIHHEVYHTTIKEIKKDIAKGRIYFLCKECHKSKHI